MEGWSGKAVEIYIYIYEITEISCQEIRSFYKGMLEGGEWRREEKSSEIRNKILEVNW